MKWFLLLNQLGQGKVVWVRLVKKPMFQTEEDTRWNGKMRKAVSMIELVVSVVVMGIVVTSVPAILTQLNDNQELMLKQEAIMAAKTRVSRVLSLDWDGNSYNSGAGYTMILSPTGASNKWLNDRNGTLRRVSAATLIPPVVSEATDDSNFSSKDTTPFDDVDDYHDTNITLAQSGIVTGDAAGDAGSLDFVYRNNINIITTVAYSVNTENPINYNARTITVNFSNTDAAAGTQTHMKHIRNTITGLGDTNVVLHSFASNIGQTDLVTATNSNKYVVSRNF